MDSVKNESLDHVDYALSEFNIKLENITEEVSELYQLSDTVKRMENIIGSLECDLIHKLRTLESKCDRLINTHSRNNNNNVFKLEGKLEDKIVELNSFIGQKVGIVEKRINNINFDTKINILFFCNFIYLFICNYYF